MKTKIKSMEDFYNESLPYLEFFNRFCWHVQIIGLGKADHICYKCQSKDSYEFLRGLLESNSSFIYQSIVSKRRIAYIKLKKPIRTSMGEIYFVELSDQKPDGSQNEGFDHIEVYPVSNPDTDLLELLKEETEIEQKIRPHHTTYDIDIGAGFEFRYTETPLLDKIKREEMV